MWLGISGGATSGSATGGTIGMTTGGITIGITVKAQPKLESSNNEMGLLSLAASFAISNYRRDVGC